MTPPSEPAGTVGPAQNKEQCLEFHRLMQSLPPEGMLRQALDFAQACTSPVCPGAVIIDCSKMISDLEQRIPSAVIEVRLDGQPNLEATLTVDGKPVKVWTRGEALKLDPGEHVFRFELAPLEPIVQRVLLGEGARFRSVVVDFKSADRSKNTGANQLEAKTAPATPPPTRTELSTPLVVYPLLGLGALGAAGFGIFAALGKNKQDSLEERCMPFCSAEETKPIKTSYLIADVSLGVGAASLITAAVVYLTRQEKPIDAAVGVRPVVGGAAAFAAYRF